MMKLSRSLAFSCHNALGDTMKTYFRLLTIASVLSIITGQTILMTASLDWRRLGTALLIVGGLTLALDRNLARYDN
jgi:lipoprotein signal peptidase